MAVYFDHRVEAPDSGGAAVLISWHSSVCVLAVGSVNASTGGCVDLYLQQVCEMISAHSDLFVHAFSAILTQLDQINNNARFQEYSIYTAV